MLIVSRFRSRLCALGNPLNIGRGLGRFKRHRLICIAYSQHVGCEGRFFRLVGLQYPIVDIEDLSGVEYTTSGVEKKTLEFSRVLADYQNSARYRRATTLFVLRMISSRLKPTCLAATKGCSCYGGFCSWFAI
ncbi:hypothetical protein Tco_1049377 [Tanacetum coccineum]